MSERPSGGSCSCGCLPLILTLLVLYALIWGLPTSWGTLELDLLPPGIYLSE